MNNENIGMEHVSESRGIAHTVDFLAGLYQMDEDRESGIINMRLIKNRLGGYIGKVVPFKLNPETLVLRDESFNSDSRVGEATETESIISNFDELQHDIDSV